MSHKSKILLVAVCLLTCIAAYTGTRHLQRSHIVSTQQTIYQTCAQHLFALQAQDLERAYMNISSSARQGVDFDNFLDQTQEDYPVLANTRDIEFSSVKIEARSAVIELYLIGHNDVVTPCYATLIKEGGSWKVSELDIRRSWPRRFRLGGVKA